MLTHDLLDGLGSLAGIVEGNPRAVVVQHVGLDDVVENVLTNEAKLSVDGGSGASGKVPLRGLVVGHSWVRVLQERNEHKPVVDANVWNDPVDKQVESAVVLVPRVQHKTLD